MESMQPLPWDGNRSLKMIRIEKRIMMLLVFLGICAIGAPGYGGTVSPGMPGGIQVAQNVQRETVVDVYHSNAVTDDERKMVSLCNQLESDVQRSAANKKNETVDVENQTGNPGSAGYHREVRTTSQTSASVDNGKTIALCRELENFSASAGSNHKTETHTYQENIETH
jgi:hypothetical protein